MGFYKNQLVKSSESPKLIRFTNDFWEMLDRLAETQKSVVEDIIWDVYSLDSNPHISNGIGIEEVDISDQNFTFNVKIKGKPMIMKISKFIKYFFGDKYDEVQIYEFAKRYNKIISGVEDKKPGKHLEPRPFRLDTKNVRETFISLVTETYPHGHEEEVVPFLPDGLSKDKYGNYYKVIGNSDTAFTCHLDTASRTKSKVNLRTFQKDGHDFIITDKTSILGADDKAGVAVILYMIAHNVPGVYWFFIGEERGAVGSRQVADNMSDYDFMSNIKKMISFDRRNYYSVITSQLSSVCCSNEFAESVCKTLNKSGLKLNLDPTGVFTDSASFMEIIPECTNISVGYFNEHTNDEIQNITYLEQLAKACVSADWDKLVVKRKIGFDNEVYKKFSGVIKDINKKVFYNNDSIKGEETKVVFKLEVDDSDVCHLYSDMTALQQIFAAHRLTPDIKFEGQYIKIELE